MGASNCTVLALASRSTASSISRCPPFAIAQVMTLRSPSTANPGSVSTNPAEIEHLPSRKVLYGLPLGVSISILAKLEDIAQADAASSGLVEAATLALHWRSPA